MANRKIILITTKGCVGCRIQRENIEKAIVNSKINIGFEVIDFDTLTKKEVIEYRNKNGNFKSIEELLNVSGIGEKLYEEIKVFITT